MIVCMSVLALAMAAVAFGAATRPERTRTADLRTTASGQTGGALLVESMAQPRVPIEALLAQIENHVRLEQAAAESFVEFPTPALLHSKTSSPFVN